ncbi:PaeR7I family type II restriction endonuclease [Nonomuraea sp. NPDC050310]|uniref:PaeR7I family type II restriction endonuclease n=1 Tax=Nonomuraea sp. NPDC050310 TaxID=3154935 RepID=UPI0033D823B3
MHKDEVRRAIESFWSTREAQRAMLEDEGKSGGAARANGHMGGIERIVVQEFLNADIPAECIKTGQPYLPGYFRVRKQWDLAVVLGDILVAAIEFKSQVGSVGKNINNRFEEALGTAADTHAAQTKNQPYGEVPPWLGYVFVLQETAETEQKNRSTKALFPTDPEFKGMSYNERYQEMVKRFIGENIYQAGWFVTTKVTDEGIVYNEPLATATAEAFAVQIRGRVEFVKAVMKARAD